LSEKLDNAITGQISFNNDGDRLNPIYIFRNVQKYGKIVPVGYYGNKEVNISVVSIISYYKKKSGETRLRTVMFAHTTYVNKVLRLHTLKNYMLIVPLPLARYKLYICCPLLTTGRWK